MPPKKAQAAKAVSMKKAAAEHEKVETEQPATESEPASKPASKPEDQVPAKEELTKDEAPEFEVNGKDEAKGDTSKKERNAYGLVGAQGQTTRRSTSTRCSHILVHQTIPHPPHLRRANC